MFGSEMESVHAECPTGCEEKPMHGGWAGRVHWGQDGELSSFMCAAPYTLLNLEDINIPESSINFETIVVVCTTTSLKPCSSFAQYAGCLFPECKTSRRSMSDAGICLETSLDVERWSLGMKTIVNRWTWRQNGIT